MSYPLARADVGKVAIQLGDACTSARLERRSVRAAQPDFERVVAVAQKYGIEMLPPA
jgi:hypothetical protein